MLIPILTAAGLLGLVAVVRYVSRNNLEILYRDFALGRAAGGTSQAEIRHEYRLRMAAAAVRRKTTEAVLLNPARYETIIKEVVKAEALQLAAFNKPMAKQFLAWADGADLSEILYPVAMQAVFQHSVKAAKMMNPDETTRLDMIAALRS